MFERDIFVALVAFGLGGFLVHAAIINRPKCFEFWLVKRIEARFGRPTARNIVGIVGVLIMLLGVFVLLFPSTTIRARREISGQSFVSNCQGGSLMVGTVG